MVIAVPVALLATAKLVAVTPIIRTFVRLKAVVERPVIVTCCPTTKLLLGVTYVMTPKEAEAPVTTAVEEGVVTLTERVEP